jgi:hypothetical protein
VGIAVCFWQLKAKQKDLKNLQFGQKRSTFKVEAKNVWRLVPQKEVPGLLFDALSRDNRKDTVRKSQELARTQSSEAQTCRNVNSFQRQV